MSNPWWIAAGRLVALVTFVGLATSRIGLVVHELVGHGGATVAVGGTVTDVKLFWLAGGWIRFEATQGQLAIALGGIVVECVVALGIWLVLRGRRSLAARLGRGVAAALVIHATWYVAVGTWHGFGDGLQLHRELGDHRWLVAVPVAGVTLAASYLGARGVFGALAATLPSRRIVGTVLALVVSGGLQLGLALGEVRLRRDTTYGATMRPENDRVVDRELARWMEAQRQQGAAPTADDRAKMQRSLADQHRTFPFALVLAILTVIAVGAGAARAQPGEAAPIGGRLLARCGVLAGGSIALVIAIDLLFL